MEAIHLIVDRGRPDIQKVPHLAKIAALVLHSTTGETTLGTSIPVVKTMCRVHPGTVNTVAEKNPTHFFHLLCPYVASLHTSTVQFLLRTVSFLPYCSMVYSTIYPWAPNAFMRASFVAILHSWPCSINDMDWSVLRTWSDIQPRMPVKLVSWKSAEAWAEFIITTMQHRSLSILLSLLSACNTLHTLATGATCLKLTSLHWSSFPIKGRLHRSLKTSIQALKNTSLQAYRRLTFFRTCA